MSKWPAQRLCERSGSHRANAYDPYSETFAARISEELVVKPAIQDSSAISRICALSAPSVNSFMLRFCSLTAMLDQFLFDIIAHQYARSTPMLTGPACVATLSGLDRRPPPTQFASGRNPARRACAVAGTLAERDAALLQEPIVNSRQCLAKIWIRQRPDQPLQPRRRTDNVSWLVAPYKQRFRHRAYGMARYFIHDLENVCEVNSTPGTDIDRSWFDRDRQ